MEKYGFVYIWRDRKHNRYYIGSHWGTEDDGYICSSTHMKRAYKRRPGDFKRKIIATNISSKKETFETETLWLRLADQKKLRSKSRYYNIKFYAGHWLSLEHSVKTKQKLSEFTKLRFSDPEERKKISEATKAGMTAEVRKKISDGKKGKPSSRLGMKHTEETLTKIRNNNYFNKGGKVTKSWKEKMRQNASGAMLGKKHTEASKQKMSEAIKGKTPWNKGIAMKPESKEKCRLANIGREPWNKGKEMSEEYKQNCSKVNIGRKRSEEAKRKTSEAIRKHWAENTVSEATREKRRKANLGKRASEEAKANMRASRLAYLERQRSLGQ